MRTIIYDLDSNELKKIQFRNDDKLIDANKCYKNCIGCFSCWIKNPKECIIKDEYSNIVDFIAQSNELILISKSRYGCYDSQVKMVLERCIGYVLPYFTIRNKEIHHESRYNKKTKLIACFYGEMSKEDKEILKKLVRANAINLNAISYETIFLDRKEDIIKCIR